MSDSVVMYVDRGNVMHVVDPDSLPHTDYLSPIMVIAVAIINAGYEGVLVDEKRLQNGRCFQALNVNMATPEGRILADVSEDNARGKLPPSSRIVLERIRNAYGAKGT